MGSLRGKAQGGAGSLDEEAVRAALAILADPLAGCQVHALPSGRCAALPGCDLDGLLRAVGLLPSGGNLYYSLNPVPHTLTKSATNRDVTSRRWLPIDLDPIKAAGFEDHPATDAEKELVAEAAQEITDHLAELGWPLPVLIDSGNGYHLLYRIDLPANDHGRQVVKAALQALRPFHGHKAKVGFECCDARRILKLPGSMARKGDASDARPYRRVRLLQVPEPLEVVPTELLIELGRDDEAKPPPVTVGTPKQPSSRWSSLRGRATNGSARAYAAAALERERQRILTARPHSEEGRNVCLNKAAFNLGGFVTAGILERREVEDALKSAARDAGLGEWEVDRTFDSGFTAGGAAPRTVPGVGHAPGTNGKADPGGEPITIRASSITPKAVRWLWPGRVPLGKLTTFAGIGGLGKTFVLLDMAARVTLGAPWPDGSASLDGEVLFISGEDDPDDTLVPRLIELGADLHRVRFLRTKVADQFTLADLDTLEKAACECEGPLRLVVIDPPTAYLGGVDDHKNAELRALLSPLKSWTQDRECSCTFNTHVNKNAAKVEAMARVMGSVAWVNAVRAAHLFARDPDDPDRVLFVPMKNNLGPRRLALAYRIVAAGDLARVEWLGDVDTTADAAINQTAPKSRKAKAAEWLVERFREKRCWHSDDLFKAARAVGISRDAMFEAKDLLDLPKAKKVSNEGGTTWFWWVPDDWPHLSQKPA